jgi:hypothetical protein
MADDEARFSVTIRHLGGARRTYVATVTQTCVLVYPSMDTPHAFNLETGRSRTLREWTVDPESLRRANAYNAIKYRTKGRARYVTGGAS